MRDHCKSNVLRWFYPADISEIGRSAKSYCEHTARTQPTLSDIVVTLVEMGEQLPLPTLPTFGSGNLPPNLGFGWCPLLWTHTAHSFPSCLIWNCWKNSGERGVLTG